MAGSISEKDLLVAAERHLTSCPLSDLLVANEAYRALGCISNKFLLNITLKRIEVEQYGGTI